MKIEDFSFGSIRIDATTYECDVVIDRARQILAYAALVVRSLEPIVSERFQFPSHRRPRCAGKNEVEADEKPDEPGGRNRPLHPEEHAQNE